MELATIVFMVVGLLLVGFAAFAVVSSIMGVRHIVLDEPAEGAPQLGRVATFQEKLSVLNSK